MLVSAHRGHLGLWNGFTGSNRVITDWRSSLLPCPSSDFIRMPDTSCGNPGRLRRSSYSVIADRRAKPIYPLSRVRHHGASASAHGRTIAGRWQTPSDPRSTRQVTQTRPEQSGTRHARPRTTTRPLVSFSQPNKTPRRFVQSSRPSFTTRRVVRSSPRTTPTHQFVQSSRPTSTTRRVAGSFQPTRTTTSAVRWVRRTPATRSITPSSSARSTSTSGTRTVRRVVRRPTTTRTVWRVTGARPATSTRRVTRPTTPTVTWKWVIRRRG